MQPALPTLTGPGPGEQTLEAEHVATALHLTANGNVIEANATQEVLLLHRGWGGGGSWGWWRRRARPRPCPRVRWCLRRCNQRIPSHGNCPLPPTPGRGLGCGSGPRRGCSRACSRLCTLNNGGSAPARPGGLHGREGGKGFTLCTGRGRGRPNPSRGRPSAGRGAPTPGPGSHRLHRHLWSLCTWEWYVATAKSEEGGRKGQPRVQDPPKRGVAGETDDASTPVLQSNPLLTWCKSKPWRRRSGGWGGGGRGGQAPSSTTCNTALTETPVLPHRTECLALSVHQSSKKRKVWTKTGP